MKRLPNASKNFVLLIIKIKYIAESEGFIGCDSKLKHELVEFVNTYEKMFQEPKGFPPLMRFICNKMQLFQILECIEF